MTDRTRLIGAVHSAAKRLGLDDGDRRALQLRVTGKASCRDMTPAELGRVLDELHKGRTAPARADARAAHQRKIKALWISAAQLGVVRDRSDRGLDHFVKRQTGVDALRFLPPDKAGPVVTALKAWMAEKGGVDWDHPDPSNERACVALALWRKLYALGAVGEDGEAALAVWARQVLNIPGRRRLNGPEWGTVLPELGRKLRAARRNESGS